ncbi:hypothetical protein ASD11_02195 [Aeromicrobium sp. Root495]|uniref:2-succinyl-5-enolpyruvyl-6-hydroxy-3- cyclohexene-1-carboxylate synthase n=1 Tax=Aeromicrobium sp. Root495 TaxID=1736550 RepID=UPI0006FC48A1|nr:thiamine pyrophosphate-binding protein [Aeromicrobium sp. Root495]KQY58496.1 hypothetical protein ASD11_02195 [Aeromicrobium sp. Root495]
MSRASASLVAYRLVEVWTFMGANDAVLAPGSRSGPLAVALHAADRAGHLRLHVRVDEREAGFLALGLAKASGRPVPVITTSGTAVANLHPAMLEALHAKIPVIAVTADRPARLRGTGANQTTDQREIFPGLPYVDSFDEIPKPPFHLNLELDEPLLDPDRVWEWDSPARPEWSMSIPRDGRVLHTVDPTRTVVVAGDSATPVPDGLPVIAEPSSGLRTSPTALTAGRLVLAHSPLAAEVERVISVGHATLSRPVTQLLARQDLEIVHVGDQSTFPVPAGPHVRFVDELAVTGPADPGWLQAWLDADAQVRAAVDAQLDGTTPLDVARTVWDAASDGLLVIGSSSPIRDLDLVATPRADAPRALANRGLAGIDGTLSTAIGAALATPEARALAVVGDLTFLHGANGLLVGPQEPRPDLTIVVVNDDGGSIFSTLEQGAPDYAEAFERVFGTPTGTDLAALCAAHGVGHRRVGAPDLAAALARPQSGIEVVEVPVSRADRRALAGRIDEAARHLFSR